MKRILIIFFIFFIYSGGFAKGNQLYTIVVKLNSGENVSFAIEKMACIRFDNNSMQISSGEKEISFEIESVLSFRYQPSSSTANLSLTKSKILLKFISSHQVSIEGKLPQDKINAYSINGKHLPIKVSDFGNNAIVTFLNEKGIYILTIGNQSFKVIVR